MRSLKIEGRQQEVINGFTVKPIRGTSWKVTGRGIEFSLCLIDQAKWRLAYQSIDGFEKSRKKKTLEAADKVEAIAEAEKLLLGSNQPDFSIESILGWWMDRNRARAKGPGERCLADYDEHNIRFIAWADARGLNTWSELGWDHIQAFANGLAQAGKRSRTIDAYTYPIRAASRKAAQNWPDRFRDFAAAYEPPRAEGRKEQSTKSLEWVGSFVLWLRDQPDGWKVLPGVALQSFLAHCVWRKPYASPGAA